MRLWRDFYVARIVYDDHIHWAWFCVFTFQFTHVDQFLHLFCLF